MQYKRFAYFKTRSLQVLKKPLWELGVTVIGVADEIACAAGLAMRKAAGIAAVLVRGCEIAPEPANDEQRGGRSMIRPREHDLFR